MPELTPNKSITIPDDPTNQLQHRRAWLENDAALIALNNLTSPTSITIIADNDANGSGTLDLQTRNINRLRVENDGTINISEDILFSGPPYPSDRFIKVTSNDAVVPFNFNESATVNADGPRKNEVVTLGWNLGAGGGPEVAGENFSGIGFESYYKPGAGAALMETHLYFGTSAGAQLRPVSLLYDRGSDVIQHIYNGDLFTWGDGLGNNSLLLTLATTTIQPTTSVTLNTPDTYFNTIALGRFLHAFQPSSALVKLAFGGDDTNYPHIVCDKTGNGSLPAIAPFGSILLRTIPDGTNGPLFVSDSATWREVRYGTVAIANGGTGQTTAANAINALLPTQTGQAGKFLTTDGSVASWATPAGGGDALVANPLSQFAATTSAQLAGVMSDETGSGALVFATSPTFSGNVGIGGTPTTRVFEIFGTGNTGIMRIVGDAATDVIVEVGSLDTAGLGIMGTFSNHDLLLLTNNSTAVTIKTSGGVLVGAPTGGDKGAGSINAVAVYDDNVLLTDWLFDLHYDGQVKAIDKHYRGQQLVDLVHARESTERERRLPWMPSRDEFESERHLGGMVSRLWQGQEQQQIYIFQLEERIKQLESIRQNH